MMPRAALRRAFGNIAIVCKYKEGDGMRGDCSQAGSGACAGAGRTHDMCAVCVGGGGGAQEARDCTAARCAARERKHYRHAGLRTLIACAGSNNGNTMSVCLLRMRSNGERVCYSPFLAECKLMKS